MVHASTGLVAPPRQHGHSVQVMLSNYAAWTEGASEADIEAIKGAMNADATATEIEHMGTPGNPSEPHSH